MVLVPRVGLIRIVFLTGAALVKKVRAWILAAKDPDLLGRVEKRVSYVTDVQQ